MSPLAQGLLPPALPTPPAPPGVSPYTLQPGVQSLDALVAQKNVLEQTIARLQAQASETRRQIQNAEGPARATLRGELGQLNVEVAQARTSLNLVKQEISGRTGLPQTQPQSRPNGGPNSEAIAAMSVVFMLAVLMPISIAFARRIWRRSPAAPKASEDTVSPRLERLENAVDAIAIEIERISEGQRFVTKVMTERPTPRANAAPVVEHPEPVLAEAKPFLALGAGPIEPIPVAQRQAVRQSITPH